jgi:hypothetical protein
MRSAIRTDPSPPGRFMVLVPIRGRVDPRATVRLAGLGHLKNLMISSGIEQATFRLVAWCLNQLRYRVLPLCAVLGAIIRPQSGCSLLSMRTAFCCGTRHCTEQCSHCVSGTGDADAARSALMNITLLASTATAPLHPLRRVIIQF